MSEAKRLFFKLRKANRIQIYEDHVISGHPERNYSIDEVLNLVRKASGKFEETNDASYLGKRFYWRTKDILDHKVRLVIEFDSDLDGQLIVVVSAGERV